MIITGFRDPWIILCVCCADVCMKNEDAFKVAWITTNEESLRYRIDFLI